MIRAYIQDELYSRSIAIALIQETEGDYPTAILRIGVDGGLDGRRWEPLDSPPGVQVPPTLRLDDSEARALLDALTRHYHGAEDTRALRRDYDQERQRVDRLTETLGVITSRLASASTNREAH